MQNLIRYYQQKLSLIMRKHTLSNYQPYFKSTDARKSFHLNTVVDQNSRIESIRQKYSKEKNLFTLRRDDSSIQKPQIKDPVKEPVKHLREPLQEARTYHHNRTNTVTSINDDRKNREGDRSINRRDLNIERLNRSGSTQYQQAKQRQQKSKQKVIERLDNISKIRDKINNLINKYDIGSGTQKLNTLPDEINLKKGMIKRNNLSSEKDTLNSSLNESKSSWNYTSQIPYKSKDAYTSSFSSIHSNSFYIERSSLKKLDETNCFSNIEIDNSIDKKLSETYHFQRFANQQKSVFQEFDKIKTEATSTPSKLSSELNELKRLISCICTQIQYDEELRIAKYTFSLNPNPTKFEKLQQEFSRRQIKRTTSQLRSEMKFFEDQYDPFMEDTTHEDYKKYVDALITASKYWKDNISKKFNYAQLIENGIKQTLKEYGKIEVADLARFVSLNSGKLYKNRDVVIIFRRISGSKMEAESKDIWRAFCEHNE